MAAVCFWEDRLPAAGSGVSAVRRAKTEPALDVSCTGAKVQKIFRLVKTLEDSDAEKRRASLEEIGKLVNGPEAASLVASNTRTLSRMLRDEDGFVRSAALSTLRKVAEGGQAAVLGVQVPEISNSLGDADVMVRQKAARLCRVIAEGGGAAGIALHIPHLLTCIELNDAVLRVAPLEALKAVADAGGAHSVAAAASGQLFTALRDEHVEVRTAASEVLAAILRSGCELPPRMCGGGLHGTGNVLDMLVTLSRDPDPTARSAGKRALMRTVLANVCADGRVSEQNGKAWATTFKGQEADEKDMFLELLRSQNVEWLRGAFKLCQPMPSLLSQISDLFQAHCKEKCAHAASTDDSSSYIGGLLDIKTNFDALVEKSFDNNSVFQNARDKGMEAVLNKDARCARELAHFSDLQLRKGRHAQDGEEVIVPIISLFSFLRDKDVFLEGYRRALAQRLLSKSSASIEEEDDFVSKLTCVSGQHSTRRLAAMLADMTLSGQLQEEYNKLSHGGAPQGIVQEVRILRANAWPGRFNSERVVPCAEFSACVHAFEAFYSSKFTARKLTWNYALGHAEMATCCFSRGHVLAVSTYQCLILMLFNKHRCPSFKQVCEATQIPRDECKRQLLSLCLAKHRLLVQNPSEEEVGDETYFMVNRDFTSDRMRVAVTSLKRQEKTQRTMPAEQQIERKHIIDAAITRVMKARKRLEHNALLEEVFRQCTLFRPQPAQIVSQIDLLIQRDFLKRDAEDRNVYNYVP